MSVSQSKEDQLLALVLAATTGLSSFALVCALWGLISSFVAEAAKQDGFSAVVNTVIADALLVVSAALATLTAASWSWHNFASALVVSATAALANHQFILKPTGAGAWIQKVTSIKKQ